MKQLTLLFVIFLLAACSKQATFSIDESTSAKQIAHNTSFKEVYNRGNYFYFKGSPSNYYGMNMADNDIFSGYLIFNGNHLCYSRLNFKGRKTFNRLLHDLKTHAMLAKESKPDEDLGWIGYTSSMNDHPPSNQIGIVTLRYNTDYGFGHIGIQSGGCLKAFFLRY